MIALAQALYSTLTPKTTLFSLAKTLSTCLWTLILCSNCTNSTAPVLPSLSQAESAWVGQQIFRNECNLKIQCLTSWNSAENFPSLGIGHFIWFQAEQKEVFVESFPALMSFYQVQGQTIPAWISALPNMDSPWPNRDDFQRDQDSSRMNELREFLLNTQATQVEFIVDRMRQSLPMLARSADNPEAITQLFIELAASQKPTGMYALIDYVNFKGEGTNPQERYNGQGWGLLQVLEHLQANRTAGPLLPQFTASASAVLEKRVENSPPQRNEAQWLPGWNKRLTTYFATPEH